MIEGARHDSRDRRRRRCWRFGSVEFDEANWDLKVDGAAVVIETKPLELLHELCLRAGETVTKGELLDTVWDGVIVVENSIPTAMAKLRRALGPSNASAIVTVQGIGYRLVVPVRVDIRSRQDGFSFQCASGAPVPGRPQWRLVDSLGHPRSGSTWTCEHQKTGERRVFKFAESADELRALKREASVARLLMAALGNDGPFATLLEWNFETAPYFVEWRHAGIDLVEWGAASGNLKTLSQEQRIEIALRAARALAAIHSVGVLHKDLKPGNVLIESRAGKLSLTFVDFGSSYVLDHASFSAFAVTPPLGETISPDGPVTPFYCAPELAAGEIPTVKSDIYALGVILFQLVVGDFSKGLAPGWESEVADPLLRSDIAEACAGNPLERIESAAILGDRLASLNERRKEIEAAKVASARLQALADRDARRQARRPWIGAAALAATVALIGTSGGMVLAARQRDAARRQEAIATASYDFLANDLIGHADPYISGQAEETVAAASARASKEIDRRFVSAPLIAARLHQSLARAFDQRSDVDLARQEYARADRAYARAGGEGGEDRRIALSQWAQLEALSGDVARLPYARELLHRAEAGGPLTGEGLVWLRSARGSLALASEDVLAAQKSFREAVAAAKAAGPAIDERQRLNLRQRVAFTYLRLGDGKEAFARLAPLRTSFARLEGPDHPDTLNIRLNMIQALLVEKKYKDVITAATELLPLMERKLGQDNRRTLQALAVRQQALGSVGRYAEAARDGERVWRATAAHEGLRAFQAVAGRADTAETQCRAGQVVTGIGNARAALVAAHLDGAPETALSMAIRTTLANCLILAGRPSEVGALLDNIDRAKVSELVGDVKWGANLDLARAELMASVGKKVGARRLLAIAAEQLGADADLFQRERISRLSALVGT